ncbi:uncharacterized protein I303_100830 [Kwoniella dejecticola CBS 10117]|uniref:BTB domain-containing protein n=1 Tax=Kwoniella dejecticola CBS 10117 TaxID=1296121 RepID=A0A1A6AG49_9TREE|nr:uncharacterized protein I303_00832 [Kwoniella dejecticola CBS 10117]OBR89011.1 hypothetical protein I303_00832 [Kwoniella dejecticola CBS 10117]
MSGAQKASQPSQVSQASSKSSESDESDDGIMVHVGYSDRSKDMILNSQCYGNIKFYVDSYMIYSTSDYIAQNKSMLSQDGEVQIHYKWEALAYVLDMMYQSEPGPPDSWTAAMDALTLCRKYQFHIIAELIRGQLKYVAHARPWEVFTLASIHGTHRLAKKAIKSMANDNKFKHLSLANLTIQDASGPTLSYLLGVLKQIHARNNSYNQDWAAIARRFRPL